jgi:DNA-binding SARP family transcriptional activator/ATP/maltotriose-dependent transcriptional regulator MalT
VGGDNDSASRLPAHYVPRGRLSALCLHERIVVLEAAGGYGKSVFAAELVDSWGAVPIWVLLEDGGVSGPMLSARLRSSVARAGFVQASEEMAGLADDPVNAIDAMLSSLRKESWAIVFDDAHNALRDAASLIDRIATQVRPPRHVIVAARHLPHGLERLRRAESAQIGAGLLALRPEETLELCRRGFGLDVTVADAGALDAATDGWTAAAVLAASRAKRASQPLLAVIGFGSASANPVRGILDEVLTAPDLDQALLAQIGHLPLLDADLLADLSGDAGLFERALAAGLPLNEGPDGWWELPGPVRDHLASLAEPTAAALRAAAAHYGQRGRLGTALQMLLAAGEEDAAAALVGEADPVRLETVDPLELVTMMDRIPAEVLDRHPAALLAMTRCLQKTTQLELRAAYVQRLARAVERNGTPELRRAADAERVYEMIRDGNEAENAEALALRVLDEAPANEVWTRARAMSGLARATLWLSDEAGLVRPADRVRASEYFEQAAQLYVSLGHHEAAALTAPYRALQIEMALGRPHAALAILDDAVSHVLDRPDLVVMLLRFRAEVQLELGRFDDCEADVCEVLRITEQLGDPRDYSAAYGEWVRLHSCSMRGDADAALEQARAVEQRRGEWWAAAGPDFLAEAADCLDRVGHTAVAWEYLERAREDPGDARHLVALAECALLARHGDPELAEERLRAAKAQRLDPREYWRVTLFQAYAALRRGDDRAGALAARAFEEAARLGLPQLPLIRERELTEALLALAVETGLPAARELQATALPIALAVLGRFDLTVGGRSVPLGAGKGAQLLKLIALSDGRLQAEQAIETLWPEVEPSAGRNRLRVVLSRLRDIAGDVVTREADELMLAPDVRLDLADFLREAREAQALRVGDPSAAVALARCAIARYRGPLLPHDAYEDWANDARDRAAGTMLDLLDICATVAADRGDLDETRRIIERTIEFAPYDEDRYLRVALILHRQGRKGAALSVLRRARAALAQMGVDPPQALAEVERRIAAPKRSGVHQTV